MKRLLAAAALGLGLSWAMTASAQEPLKIGVILPYSGPFADAANQLEAGINDDMNTLGAASTAVYSG